ncbi:four-carbon acid sugar kinase family protein [Streptomyces sp. A7024]|uniref:Four-carbon acid sugar kinase family protein n=1 Tax=Streptomyces coryli TaxID=1128680 RepID=A0A6G4UF35_9ACTN|nr:four-carbon acid sugar kinase family protein [Streptomyces coryli]
MIAAFYADDVTGATDALAQFHRAGLRSLLLFGAPGPGELRRLARTHDVIGVAGVARSLPAGEMAAEVEPVLAGLRALRPRLVQYKICSTADSSPAVGSLGRAIEIGRDVFGTGAVPVLAAQPELGRYTAFGHHFAADGGTVHRLDRQPTMAQHPVTPMTEADLRLHLGHQTRLPIGSLDLTAYEQPWPEVLRRYERAAADGVGAVVLDTVTDAHLLLAARLVLSGGEMTYALGSGGLSRGAAAWLASTAGLAAVAPVAGAEGPVLVVSGSCAARTAEQIRRAQAAGWQTVPMDVSAGGAAPESDAPSPTDPVLLHLRDTTLRALAAAPGVIVHTALGPPQTHAVVSPSATGRVLAHLVAEAVVHAGVRRVDIAGGDTAGQVLRALGARTAEIAALLGPGTALCRLGPEPAALAGVEVLLKGGQAGHPDLFERLSGVGDPTTAGELCGTGTGTGTGDPTADRLPGTAAPTSTARQES